MPGTEHAPWGFELTPVRAGERRDARRPQGEEPEQPEPAATPTVAEIADLERGRTAALFAALGRVQVSLDVLTRKVGAIEERLARLDNGARERRQ